MMKERVPSVILVYRPPAAHARLPTSVVRGSNARYGLISVRVEAAGSFTSGARVCTVKSGQAPRKPFTAADTQLHAPFHSETRSQIITVLHGSQLFFAPAKNRSFQSTQVVQVEESSSYVTKVRTQGVTLLSQSAGTAHPVGELSAPANTAGHSPFFFFLSSDDVRSTSVARIQSFQTPCSAALYQPILFFVFAANT